MTSIHGQMWAQHVTSKASDHVKNIKQHCQHLTKVSATATEDYFSLLADPKIIFSKYHRGCET